MNVSLYQAAAAMNAQARWQEMITENLGAGSVPGFRKQDISFSAVQAGLDPTAIGRNSPGYSIPVAHTATNFRTGDLRATGSAMDFALEGSGFFEVQLPNGTHSYTRSGEFHLSAQGQLITKQGYPVLSENGPIQIDPNLGSTLTVSATGDLSQGGEVRGRIRVVEFADPQKLTDLGGGYFAADKPEAIPTTATGTQMRQGFLEASNTSPTGEMADLILSMRMFESNQRVLQMQDERMGRVINELGNPS